jgi:hypothetical protein
MKTIVSHENWETIAIKFALLFSLNLIFAKVNNNLIDIISLFDSNE